MYKTNNFWRYERVLLRNVENFVKNWLFNTEILKIIKGQKH